MAQLRFSAYSLLSSLAFLIIHLPFSPLQWCCEFGWWVFFVNIFAFEHAPRRMYGRFPPRISAATFSGIIASGSTFCRKLVALHAEGDRRQTMRIMNRFRGIPDNSRNACELGNALGGGLYGFNNSAIPL